MWILSAKEKWQDETAVIMWNSERCWGGWFWRRPFLNTGHLIYGDSKRLFIYLAAVSLWLEGVSISLYVILVRFIDTETIQMLKNYEHKSNYWIVRQNSTKWKLVYCFGQKIDERKNVQAQPACFLRVREVYEAIPGASPSPYNKRRERNSTNSH